MTSLPTNTDIRRIAKVFQDISGLIERDALEATVPAVPNEIESLVLNLQAAYQRFNFGIEQYMHKKKRHVNEVETVKAIIRNPYYLTVKNEEGNLPIHTAAQDASSSSTYVPLLAQAGVQHGVGGSRGRGGLLVKEAEHAIRPIKNIAFKGDLSTMQALRNIEPPLLTKCDVPKYLLIHCTIRYSHNLEMMKMLIEMNPAALYTRCNKGKLPLHMISTLDATKLLLDKAIECDPNHSSVGGLFAKNKEGILPIRQIISRYGKEDGWKCIEEALSRHKEVPILHKAIRHTPELIEDVISSFPHSCFLRDRDGRLPIHMALERGIEWGPDLVSLINANMAHLDYVDPVTKLCPYALAAMRPACDLRTINYLLQLHPKHVSQSLHL
jgi:hypothetical protein